MELNNISPNTQPAFKLPDGEILDLEEYILWLEEKIKELKS